MDGTRTAHVLQLTDPHLFADRGASIYGVRTADSFRAALVQALGGGARRPDAVLVTGDIGDDLSPGAYRNFLDAVAGIGAPVYTLPGNHDSPAAMARLLDGPGLQFCGRATLGAWGAVLLDTHVDGADDGLVAAAELERLDRDVREFGDRPVLVCLHHPPFAVGSEWLDGVGLRNGADVMRRVRAHPQVRAVLCGHVHQAFDAQAGGLRLLATPSTCAQFAPRTPAAVMDTRPPGWRWLHLHPDGSLDTEVHWLEGWQVDSPPPDSRAGVDGATA